MVEEIITALSRFKWLFVIARNSSFTFKGRAVDIKEVGRWLGVRYVLEGSVRKASGKVRITGQLIDAVTGAHIWVDRFERDLTDVFVLQDEVTIAVVSAIEPKMFQTEIDLATRRRPENLTAYDLLLRALPPFYLTTREGLAEAMRLAHRALELDPGFASAARLAGACHNANVLLGYSNDPQFDRKEAVRLARLALSIDDSDPDTLATAAVISAFMVRDSEAEIEMADRAVALNPNSWDAWNSRGMVYRIAGLPEEAIRSFERAIRLSPVDPRLYVTLTGIGLAFIELRIPNGAPHTTVPNKAPTPAVNPIASAPQKVTRIAPTATRAPPALAANAPKSARNSSEVAGTKITRLASGTKAVVKIGMAAPTEKLRADANAA